MKVFIKFLIHIGKFLNLKHNILANYFSQAYVAALGIITVPFYINYMGVEAYGLIGFYTVLQAWFQLLDAGLSSTLARESSRFSAGVGDVSTLNMLRRFLEIIFLIIGVAGILFFIFFAPMISQNWLKVGELNQLEVINSIKFMGFIVAFRWMSCLYRGMIAGFERQVWLGSFNVGVATARYLLCLPIIIFWNSSPTIYFSYQMAISLLELLGLYAKVNQLLPFNLNSIGIDRATLRNPLKFTTGVALTSVIGILMTQADKLLLSKFIPLADFGEFSLAVLLSGGINLLAIPIGMALQPSLTKIAATADERELCKVYKYYTQVMCIAVFPAAFTLYSCAMPILFAWTGSVLSFSTALVLGVYGLGNAVMNVAAFAYYVQYAKGNVRLHLIGNLLFAIIYLPFVFWIAQTYGAVGAAFSWLLVNILYFIFWVPLVHATLTPGLHMNWILKDVFPIVFGASIPAVFMWFFSLNGFNGIGRWSGAFYSVIFYIFSLGGALFFSINFRNFLKVEIRRNRIN